MHGTRQKRTLVWTLVAIGALIAAGGAWYWFAPKPSESMDDAAPAQATELAMGMFRDGAPGHTVTGTVQLLRDADGYVLHFEDYDATAGPAVYFYLTRGAFDTEGVEGQGLRIETDTMSGQATLRGSFNVALPAGVDAADYSGVAVWCERFDVLFGSASLA